MFAIGQQSKDEEDGPDLIDKRYHDTCRHSTFLTSDIEYERRFLSNLRSDWLDEVMIGDNSPGTCEWVLDSRPFKAWLSRIEPTLTILGDAGMGKTVLAKFIYRQLCGEFSNSSDSPTTNRPQRTSLDSTIFPRPRHTFAYFFDMRNSARNSGLSALQSLLYQILSTEQDLFKYIHRKPIFSRPRWTEFGQYVEVLNEISHDPSLHGTVIILDALDECEEDSRQPIFEMLSTLAEQSSIQLLVTSRSQWDHKPYLTINLNDSVEHVKLDVEKYVKTAVKELADAGEFSPDLESYTISKILQQSSGSFLWVQLVLQSVLKARTVRMVRNVLEQLPKDLKESYSVALNGATGFTGVNLRRALYFVMIAKVPLHVRELSALLALSQCWDNPGSTFLDRSRTADVSMILNMEEIMENQTMSLERDLEKDFLPLLKIEGNSISLVHFTLRDFLEEEAGTHLRAAFDFPQLNLTQLGLSDVHTMVAILCLQYMLASFHDNDDPLGFMNFACLYWTEHARESRGELIWLLESLMRILFLENPDFSSMWLDSVLSAKTMPLTLLLENPGLAFVLAAFDLAKVFGTTFHISVEDLESTNQLRQTPLHYAAANNALSSTQWLQSVYDVAGKHFGDVATMKDIHGQSPISLAAQNGHDELVKLLLTSIGSSHDFDLMLFQTIAATGNREMFETVYDHTKFEYPDQRLSLLTSAVKLDSVGLMKKIYDEYGIQGDASGIPAATHGAGDDPLLHVALQSHAYDVLDFLLDTKDYRDVIDRYGNTVLHIAAQEGSEKTAHKLITAGAVVDTINERGETPLHIASSIRLPAMVRLLCENGANVNVRGPSGCSPVHLATKTGHEEMIDTLLHHGSNIFATDNNGRSVLHMAAEAGQEAILAALLGHCADVNAQDFQGRTPVHYAVRSGVLSILYMLCGAGADLSALDLENTAPLHIAAERNSDIMVRELLCLGADPNPRDSKGRTPLHYGCLAKRSARTVVKTLIKAGADVNNQDHDGLSPLHYACLSEYAGGDIVKLLLYSGTDIDHPARDGKLPLHYGIQKGKVRIIKLLIQSSGTVPAGDMEELTALGWI